MPFGHLTLLPPPPPPPPFPPPVQVLAFLNDLFAKFDNSIEPFGVHKVCGRVGAWGRGACALAASCRQNLTTAPHTDAPACPRPAAPCCPLLPPHLVCPPQMETIGGLFIVAGGLLREEEDGAVAVRERWDPLHAEKVRARVPLDLDPNLDLDLLLTLVSEYKGKNARLIVCAPRVRLL